MATSIIEESRLNYQMANDLDNLRSSYIEETAYIDIFDSSHEISVYYPAFEVYALEKNRFRLLANCAPVDFLPRWDMRPDYLSYDMYGTVIYWPVILFVNNLNTIEEFTSLDKVLIPTHNVVKSLVLDRLPADHYETINTDTSSDQDLLTLYKYGLLQSDRFDKKESKDNIYTFDNSSANIVKIYENINYTDTFTINSTINKRKYVILNNEPNLSSVLVYFEGFVNELVYGRDYIITNTKTISWNNLQYSVLNSPSARVGKLITVKYTKTVLKTT